jgi:hypothetical protein
LFIIPIATLISVVQCRTQTKRKKFPYGPKLADASRAKIFFVAMTTGLFIAALLIFVFCHLQRFSLQETTTQKPNKTLLVRTTTLTLLYCKVLYNPKCEKLFLFTSDKLEFKLVRLAPQANKANI